ncbi:MAG TPA: hypothetical protein VNN79_14305 [Actinomycetota bacterium]|nr:hypothetical protein [Actinomycetota bacterium]
MLDLFEFEAVPDDGGGGGAESAAPEPAEPEPTPDVATEGEPAEPTPASPESAFQDTPEFRDAVYAEAQAVVDARLSQMFGQPQQQFNPPIAGATPGPLAGIDPAMLDPYSEDFGVNLLTAMQGLIQQGIAPVTQTFEQQQYAATLERGNEALRDIVSDAVSAGDEITEESKGIVEPLATAMFAQFAERYGETNPRAAEAAVYHVVDTLRAIEKAAEARGAARQANQLATLAGAPAAEPGTAATAPGVPGQPQRYLSPDEIAQKYALA